MLWFTRMPPPRAGGPRSTGLQCRGLDGSPTALAHQLPRVAGSTPGLEPKVTDQGRAVLLAARVRAKAVSLHPQSLRSCDCCQP